MADGSVDFVADLDEAQLEARKEFLNSSEFIAIERSKLQFSNRRDTKRLEVISTCECVEYNVKAVVEGDSSGASFIVLSREKLMRAPEDVRERVMGILTNMDAVRTDITEFSHDITNAERVKRRIFLSKIEKETLAAKKAA